jgi:hypothetical protein
MHVKKLSFRTNFSANTPGSSFLLCVSSFGRFQAGSRRGVGTTFASSSNVVVLMGAT